MKKNAILFWLMLSLICCNKQEIIYLYSQDKKHCVTILNIDDIRYIADGKNKNVPDTNYIKLNIRNIDPLGDALHICWHGKHGWDIVVHNSEIIESKLDTSMFKFNTTLPNNEKGIPTETKFRKEDCAIFDFYRMMLSSETETVVEY